MFVLHPSHTIPTIQFAQIHAQSWHGGRVEEDPRNRRRPRSQWSRRRIR